MATARKETAEEVFASFLGDNWTVIADPVSSVRARLAHSLIGMGAKQSKIALASSLEDAKNEIARRKPKLILCDYQLGSRSGLDLLQEQRAEVPESKECLFVLITGNTSQSAVARAAEEDVDAFILKPYTPEVLKKSLLQAAMSKLRPSDYQKKIEEGKDALLSGQADNALKIFTEAIKLDKSPSLAYFYRGQAEQMKKTIESAQNSYKGGLKIQKIHYKCLAGLFDILQRQKRSEEAYDVVKRMAQYFPANPKRLASVLRLAIVTKNYDDIEGFYRIFTNLDSREDELVRYICSALCVTGKHYLRSKVNRRALELFEKVAATSAGRVKFIRFVIETLIEYKLVNEAKAQLGRFPADTQSQKDFLICQYLVVDAERPAVESVQLGKDLIAKNIHDPLFYKTLISRLFSIGKANSAEDLIERAYKLWPERKEEFSEHLTQLQAKERQAG